MSKGVAISQKKIENGIFTVRGEQVMVDRDCAEDYLIKTRVLNRAAKRNLPTANRSYPCDDQNALHDAGVEIFVSNWKLDEK